MSGLLHSRHPDRPPSSPAVLPAPESRLIAVLGLCDPARAELARALHAAVQAIVPDAIRLSEPDSAAVAQALRRHTLVVADDRSPGFTAPPIRVDLCLLDSGGTPGDAALRLALLQAGVGFSVLTGPPGARLQAALAAWKAHRRSRVAPPAADGAAAPRWRHLCGRCGDGDCERHLFERLRPRP